MFFETNTCSLLSELPEPNLFIGAVLVYTTQSTQLHTHCLHYSWHGPATGSVGQLTAELQICGIVVTEGKGIQHTGKSC